MMISVRGTGPTRAAPLSSATLMLTTLHVRLPNDVTVRIEVDVPGALPSVLAELAALRC
jgi:hypothetical protein